MSHNYYSEINLHLTWHTKDTRPLLTRELEPHVHKFLRTRMMENEGVLVHEIGGTDTHIHVAVSIPPTLPISEFIGQLKGASSHEANHFSGRRDAVLQWQAGYGVVSFGTGDLDWVRGYIRNQRSHHQCGKAIERLERITADDA